jgi:hypothetical protein
MATDGDGATATNGEVRVFVVDGDGAAYGVPPEVIERHRVSPERRTRLHALIGEGASTGAAAATLAADAPAYELPREALAPYRLSDEERAAAEAQRPGEGTDTGGFGQFIGVFPGWVAVEPKQSGIAAGRSQVHTYSAAFWFNSGGGASRHGAYPGLR